MLHKDIIGIWPAAMSSDGWFKQYIRDRLNGVLRLHIYLYYIPSSDSEKKEWEWLVENNSDMVATGLPPVVVGRARVKIIELRAITGRYEIALQGEKDV